MITDTMTREEFRKEIIAEEQWVQERMFGLRKKYHKQLKDRRVRENAFLGTSTYKTPRGNEVFVCVFKTFMDRKEKYADIAIAALYSYWYGNKRRYIFPLNEPGTTNYKHSLVFSAHSVARMKERLGMDITEVFIQNQKMQFGCSSFLDYDRNGSGEYYCDFGACILLAKDHPWGLIVSTAIAKEQQFTDQMPLGVRSSHNANILSLKGAKSTWQAFDAVKRHFKRICIKQAS